MSETSGLRIGHYIDRTYGKVPLKLVGRASAGAMASFLIEEGDNISSMVAVEDWDAFVVVGLGFSLVRLVEKWTSFQPDCLSEPVGEHLLVPELVDGYDNAGMDTTKALALIRKLRTLTDKPISLVPGPLPAAWVLNRSGGRFDSFQPFAGYRNRAFLLAQFEKQVNRVRAMGVDVVNPPEETVIDDMWTRTEFCLGQPSDPSPDSFYAKGDFYHMNREYGDLVSRSIMQEKVLQGIGNSLGTKE
ncbi:hypothetical protein V3C33_10720 [Micrococcaceae bacterium Sec5.7]